MLYVLVSVIFSVTVSVILKLARRYAVDTTQIIVWNYPVAVLAAWFFLDPPVRGLPWASMPWPVYLGLGVLLPGIFVAIAASIRYTGIVRTEVAQRISLIIPLIAAFWLFGESADWLTLVGVAIGLAAIMCSIGWRSGRNQYGTNRKVWLYPLIVFVGLGVVDVLFKQVATLQAISYSSSLLIVFTLAMLVAFAYLAYSIVRQRSRLSIHAIFWGIVLGLFNFGNILFYMKAHRALPDNPSIVFTGMNIGVILLGAVVGVSLFKEKLSKLNIVGLFLAVLSVIVIFWDELIR